MQDRLESFSSLEHIDYLQNVLIPKIDSYTNIIGNFSIDNTNMRECIRGFDEVISIKANKSSFQILKEEFE